jgi:glycosyltransferase involved in cell wall biosynthesis
MRQSTARSEEIQSSGLLTEHIIYIQKEHGLLKKLWRQWTWFKQYRRAINRYVETHGRPHLVHVHVPWRVGWIALWLKRTIGIPYIITEHWDIYNNVVADNFSRQPWWVRQLIKKIYSRAEMIAPVSRYITTEISRYVIPQKAVIIPNVVDTALFAYNEARPRPFVFLHVSNMVFKKNVAGILEAFAAFQLTVADAQLVLVGNKDDIYIRYAEGLNIKRDSICFRGEIPYADVASQMQAAHCLILNSHIENSPCVIGEALCCGLPVIATAVGGIPELVHPANSILIPPDSTSALLKAMQEVYADFKKFDRAAIAAAAAEIFSIETISRQFDKLYASCCA